MLSMVEKLLRRRTGVLARVIQKRIAVRWCALNKCPGHQCIQVCTFHRVFVIRAHTCDTIAQRQLVHKRSCMHSLFIRLGDEGRRGVSTCLCRALVAWCMRLFLTEGEIDVLPYVFYIFDAGGSVCVCMCVYTHSTRTHTHTLHMQ